MKSTPWLLALAAVVVAGGAVRVCQGAERDRGATVAALAVAEARAHSLAQRRAVADTVYRTATRTLTRTLATVDTLRDSLTLTDTVEVIRFIAAQDTAIISCRAAITSCEVRVALADSLTRNAENRLMLTRRLVNAPRTAVGIAYDPQSGRVGASFDRDLWRVRAGVTVIPDAGGLRAGLRVSWWW